MNNIVEPNKTFFEFFKNGTYPGTNVQFLKEFAIRHPYEYLLFTIYAKKIATSYWSDDAYFEFLEKAWKGFDQYARKNALRIWQTIMLNGYQDPSNNVISSVLDIIAKGLGVLFGGATTINSLIIHGDRLDLQRQMFSISTNGPSIITPELFDEVFLKN